MSKGEVRIEEWLRENQISFTTQKTFSDLRSDKNRRLRFDFEVLDNTKNLKYLIEYDGPQHFRTMTGTFAKSSSLSLIQKYDKQKK